MNREIRELKKKGYLHYFDGEMYFIICLSYLFGFAGGYIRAWILPISLIFLGYPFYLKWKKDKQKSRH